jgi:AcrR family transcriptional regulator
MARAGASARALRDERRAEVERRLVTTLKRLIVEEPRFTDLKLSRLLEETGVSRTSFYKYFDSKSDVLAAWFSDAVEQLLNAPRPQAGADPPTREDLRSALQAVADVYRERLPLMAAVYETAAHEYDMRVRVAEALTEFEARVRRHITRGQREGWINPEIDPAAMARWIVALCESGLRHIIGPAKPAAVPEAVAVGADTIWFTLYAPAQKWPA